MDWSGPDTAIRPRIDKAVKLLGRSYAISESRDSEESALDGLSRAEQEARLIAFVERGETISAVILAKHLYGYDTTEARTFVESLT